MNPFRFHPDAELEMNQAAAWYENQQKTLGRRFLTSIQDALNRIQLHPELYPIVEGGVRRCLLRTFPFGVLFRVTPGVFVVIAVMHLNRDPSYWRNRVFEQ